MIIVVIISSRDLCDDDNNVEDDNDDDFSSLRVPLTVILSRARRDAINRRGF